MGRVKGKERRGKERKGKERKGKGKDESNLSLEKMRTLVSSLSFFVFPFLLFFYASMNLCIYLVQSDHASACSM